ncbi:MAG: cobalamin-dependent protein [Gemmatimonadales bacterium]|jgi:methylmalonyl-CoA mutase cobalamin-binding domain/chain
MTDPDWAADLGAAVLEGDAGQARELTERALDAGVAPEQVLEAGLIPAMAEAGRRFEDQRFFLPELMLAARAMKAAMELIKPLLAERDVPPVGRVVIGTVAGDLHDIGKNIVAAMLEGGGFAVHDLGIDVTPAAFAAAVREHDADIAGLSALLTTTMPVMRDVVTELERAGVRDRVKVLVGGAPLTEAYAAEIGADAYAATAAGAVAVAQRLLAGEPTGPPAGAASPRSAEVAPSPAAAVGPPRSAPGPDPSAAPTPRQLVKGALEFQRPARLPRQLWVLPWAAKRYPDELDRIERDFPPDITTIPVFCSEPVPGGGNAHTVGTFVDAWGCTFLNLQEGIIGQVKQPVVTDWSDTDHVRFPRERLAVDREEVAAFCAATGRFVLAGTCPRPFERLQFLRGPENLYLDLNRPSAELREFLERLHAFYIEELTLWAQTDVDALTFMDDWGSQRALLIAPELWRELFKPLYADYIAIAHDHGKYAFMHSDGYITEIIPDLIEIGLDALNSQVFCMDLEELGRRFAGQLTFWGELDRQQMLPRATAAEIAEAALRLQAAFHREGGFIAQCEFGPGARPENVYAFFAACAGG